MSVSSSRLAKRMPGTRMAPGGSIRHAYVDSRLRRERSMSVPPGQIHGRSDIHDALGDPFALPVAIDLEFGIGDALDLDGRRVAAHVDGLSRRGAGERTHLGRAGRPRRFGRRTLQGRNIE